MSADAVKHAYVERLADYLGDRLVVEPSAILGQSRGAVRVSRGRQLLMFWLRQLGWSLDDIGWHLGRDHSTVSHALERIPRLLGSDPDIADAFRHMPRPQQRQFTRPDLLALYSQLDAHLAAAAAVRAQIDDELVRRDVPRRVPLVTEAAFERRLRAFEVSEALA